MIKCVAIDDEANALKVIEHYAEKVEKLQLLATFTDPVKAIDYLGENEVDLIFLDINMSGMNGFELLESLTHKPQVIFTTAYSEFALKSYSVDALDYLMKPIVFSRFLKAINKASQRLPGAGIKKHAMDAREERVISVKSGTTIHRINLNEILYLQADGNYTRFISANEVIMVLCTMKEALEKVDDLFVQTHRSFAVAVDKVNKIENHELTIGTKTIPIGATFRKEVLTMFS